MIKLLADRVLLKVETTREKTESGIVLPEVSQGKAQTASVYAVGPGRILDDGTRTPLGVTTGDRVIYSKLTGTEINVEGQDLLLVHERDIIGII